MTIDQALVDAGLDRLRADSLLTVYDGVVPQTPADHYVLVYSQVEWPDDDPDNTVEGKTEAVTARWICHCVGPTAVSARAVAQRVRTQLLDHRPTVAGVECAPIGQAESVPPTRDESTGRLVMDAVAVYELTARI
ncbi:MAG TPA: hypothetical protein VF223_04105 [Trebonia sp.]